RYYFVVSSINNTYPPVESAYSNEESAVPAPVVPGTPEMFPVASSEKKSERNGAIKVSWGRMPPENMAGYNVYISEKSGEGYAKANSSPVNDTYYIVKGLEVGKKYYFVLTSVTDDVPPVESSFSREWSDVAKPESTIE
ncbi:MAG: fibronectin type III domain-containing protein, partial [bacterium]